MAFVIGSLAGTVAGMILGISPTLNAIFGLFLTPLNSVPCMALAPLFIAWFGLRMTAKVALAAIIAFFSSSYQINTVFAILIMLMLVAMVVDLGFNAIERRLLRWQKA